MSCPCLQSNPIPICIETLIIGTIGKINTPLIVSITNIATGRIDSFETLSDSEGLTTIEVDEFEINDGENYKVEVYIEGDLSEVPETITINDVSDSCVYFTGKKVNGVDITEAALSTTSNSDQPTSRRPIYHYTEVDYSVPDYIETVGVGTQNGQVQVYYGNPNLYEKGKIMSVSDEQKLASVNNIIINAPFELGNPQIINSDGGSKSFYSNGVDKFIIVATN